MRLLGLMTGPRLFARTGGSGGQSRRSQLAQSRISLAWGSVLSKTVSDGQQQIGNMMETKLWIASFSSKTWSRACRLV